MRVKLIPSGEITDVSSSYGARLIEQGKAAALPRERRQQVARPADAVKRKEREAAEKPPGDA